MFTIFIQTINSEWNSNSFSFALRERNLVTNLKHSQKIVYIRLILELSSKTSYSKHPYHAVTLLNNRDLESPSLISQNSTFLSCVPWIWDTKKLPAFKVKNIKIKGWSLAIKFVIILLQKKIHNFCYFYPLYYCCCRFFFFSSLPFVNFLQSSAHMFRFLNADSSLTGRMPSLVSSEIIFCWLSN